jgi:3',5'-cyclic AMP phosphodiesterase CpdA
MKTASLKTWNRRDFLALSAAAGAFPIQLHAAAKPPEDFTFLFITDAHLQPELNAAKGCQQAFTHARSVPADFAIQGGDHVFDALGVGRDRATSLIDLYTKTEQDLGLKVYHTIGNHDCFGVFPASGVSPTDPLYGKKYFEDHFGKLYYSFDHKGVHFIVLDSIGITADRAYEGRVDDAQLAWLAADLKALPARTPIIVTIHIPLVTAFDSYGPAPAQLPTHHAMSVANAYEVVPLFEGHNVLGVLQGHTHINETVVWHGVPYITSGAVSGNWWHGTRLGTPEGFTVVRVAGGKLTTRYETYGFQSVAPQNT